MAEWWVRQGSQEPLGPMPAELLIRGIRAGKVPIESEVCPVGGREWLPLEAIEEFQDAFPADSVRTHVIESPWFLEQSPASQPSARSHPIPPPPPPAPAGSQAYQDDVDDQANTRVARPSRDVAAPPPTPQRAKPPPPRPAAGAPVATTVEVSTQPRAQPRPFAPRPPPVPNRQPAPPPVGLDPTMKALIALIILLSAALAVVLLLLAGR